MLKQPMQEITIRGYCPKTIDLALLDEWFDAVLQIEVDYQKDTDTDSLLEKLMQRSLPLIRTLLQSIGIPCFDLGKVVSCNENIEDPLQCSVTIAIVKIDNFPQSNYQAIVNFSLKSMLWMMDHQKTAKNIKYLYNSIQSEVLSKSRISTSTVGVLNIAYEQNIPFFHLIGEIYHLGMGKNSRLINRSINDLDSHLGTQMSENKKATSNFIQMAGLPAPINGVALNIENAFLLAKSIGWPVVVKPVDGNRGEGVTIGVVNEKQLSNAFELAMRFSKVKQVIIEKEVQGVAHRIFIVNEKLLYVLKRLPKSVVGDGEKQVLELIEDANKDFENTPPWMRKGGMYPADDKAAIEAMKNAGYTLKSVPKKGELIPLRKIESTVDGIYPVDLTKLIHPDNLDISLRAAKLFGLSVAGIDIISTDITKPWYENGAIINEVNSAPALGANEISKKYIPDFFKLVINNKGRIPIYVFVGDDKAMEMAIQYQNELIETGVACFLSSHNKSIDNFRKEMFFTFQNLEKRYKALLFDRRVEAIVLVVQTDEFLYTGLPMDEITQITTINKNLANVQDMNKKTSLNKVNTLLGLFQKILI